MSKYSQGLLSNNGEGESAVLNSRVEKGRTRIRRRKGSTRPRRIEGNGGGGDSDD